LWKHPRVNPLKNPVLGQGELGNRLGQVMAGHLQGCLGLRPGGGIILGVEFHQNLPGFDPVAFLDQDPVNARGDFSAQANQIPLHLGVVGGDVVPAK